MASSLSSRPRLLLALNGLAFGRQLFGVAQGAVWVLARQAAVYGADGKSRRDGDVRQAKSREGAAHQLAAGGGGKAHGQLR